MAHDTKTHEWFDSTTYSRDDNQKIPNVWSYKTGQLTITVVKHHRNYPNKWILHCRHIGISDGQMKPSHDTPLAEIQSLAIRIVQRKLELMLGSFSQKPIQP